MGTEQLLIENEFLRSEIERLKRGEFTPEEFQDLKLRLEVLSLRRWVADLQEGQSVNCVYCGYNYGPSSSTPVSMADVLRQHVMHCPKHPMNELRLANAMLEEKVRALEKAAGMRR